ncbi:MAG: OsmC family protein [SAR202 cluster bacterium]|nr:OsmC family protein [SAR202 cluster bacterium]
MMDAFRWKVRVKGSFGKGAMVYVRQHRFESGAAASFDIEHPKVSAVEYALGALGADVVAMLQAVCRERRIEVNEVEAVVSGELGSPETHLNVVDAKGNPGMAGVEVAVFASSPAPEAVLRAAWDEALRRSPLVNTLGEMVNLELRVDI